VSRSTNPPNRRYGSLPDVALYLGKTNKAVEKLVERGQIPVKRLNRRLIFNFNLLDQWVASLPGTTLEEALDRCTGAAEGALVTGRPRKSTRRKGREGEKHTYINHSYSLEDIQKCIQRNRKEAVRCDGERP
jgi:hypothetical protein